MSGNFFLYEQNSVTKKYTAIKVRGIHLFLLYVRNATWVYSNASHNIMRSSGVSHVTNMRESRILFQAMFRHVSVPELMKSKTNIKQGFYNNFLVL